MNSSVTRTELLAFWNDDRAVRRAVERAVVAGGDERPAFRSSSALQRMKSMTSGWSTFSTTILAARRVLPPDLMTPADASAAFMNDTGPDAVPPPASRSRDERMRDRFTPEPGAAFEDDALAAVPVEDRVHGVVDGEDEAGASTAASARRRR